MNVNIIRLPSITCHHSHTKAILEAIVNTILFTRTAGMPILPRTVESYLFEDLNYSIINRTVVQDEITKQIKEIVQLPSSKFHVINVSLYYSVKKYGFLGEYMEKNEFERWKIELYYTRGYTMENMREEMNTIMNTILNYSEIPQQLPSEEKFSFSITHTTSASSPYYDLFGSIPKLFGTP